MKNIAKKDITGNSRKHEDIALKILQKKLQEAAEQAKTTEQKREEQSAAGNVLSKVAFHFMMTVDKSLESKNTGKASNLAFVRFWRRRSTKLICSI